MIPHSKAIRIKAAAIILGDILWVGVVLVVFALFHHVLPNPGTAIERVVSFETGVSAQPPSPAAIQPRPSAQAAATASPAATTSSAATASPAATPPASIGDFSAAFPAEDTGIGALYSDQGENVKIAIRQVKQNDVTYFVADVWVKNIRAFRTAFAKNQYGTGIHQDPLKIANANNATFAITGDYYGARNKGVVIRNGDLYRDSLNGDICVLYANGAMETYQEKAFDVLTLSDNDVWQAWSFGPLLLENGQAIKQFNSAIKGKNPRNAIGYYEPGHYCFVTVDGRQAGYSRGMTLAELSEVFASLGCKTAYNLDGGATAEMIFQGRVINKPYKGGRQCSDIICF